MQATLNAVDTTAANTDSTPQEPEGAPIYYLRNLSGSETKEGSLPPKVKERPYLESKVKYGQWCERASTDHFFFSGSEGMSPLGRVSKSNPVAAIRAIVADYDSPAEQSEWAAGLRKFSAGLMPTFLSQTFSGGVRAIWLFTAPVPVAGASMAREFLKIAKGKLGAKRGFANLDVPAFENPVQYYEAGTEWQRVGDLLDSDIVRAWLMEAGEKTEFEGVEIPLDDIKCELEKCFPGKWHGAFEEGSRGPRFWDASADNETAAIVRKEGMQTFTGGTAFVPWGEIFGAKFMRDYIEGRIGAAVDGVYYDGRQYWTNPGECWVPSTKEDVTLWLRKKGLSTEKTKTSLSEVEEALVYIQRNCRMDFCAPLVFQGGPIINVNGYRFLNTARVAAVQPCEETGLAWGQGFPWIAEFIGNYFDEPATHQREVFLAWLKRFYTGCLGQNLADGQTLFISGPNDRGKSLLSRRIIAGLAGGSADPSAFLMKETAFNRELGQKAVWTIDDNSSGGDERKRTAFGETVKRVTSGVGFPYQAKFCDQVDLPWHGRIVVTMNEDPEALRVIPNTESSIMDKLIFLKCSAEKPSFPPTEELEACIKGELPALGRYILEWTPPTHVMGRNRFGVEAYHHADMLNDAQSGEAMSSIDDLLDIMAREIATQDKTAVDWRGTTVDILAWFISHDMGDVVKSFSGTGMAFGRQLSKLASRKGSRLTKPGNTGGKARFCLAIRPPGEEPF